MHINAIGLRRMTAKFARYHFESYYPTPIPQFNGTAVPKENQLISKLQTKYPEITFQSDFVMKLYHQINKFTQLYHHPPRVALYTRGDSGLGRTMAKETLLLDILKVLGTETHFCCDFTCDTFEHQIALSYHSDIVSKISPLQFLFYLFYYYYYY